MERTKEEHVPKRVETALAAGMETWDIIRVHARENVDGYNTVTGFSESFRAVAMRGVNYT